MKKKVLAGIFGLTVLLGSALPADAATLTYYYDALGRIQEIDYDNGIWIYYGYDPVGNRWIYAMDCYPGYPCI